jgi:rubrerythrin
VTLQEGEMGHAYGPVFSNLAKACEKQYRQREAELLWKVAAYFAGYATGGDAAGFAELASAIGSDEAQYIAPAREAAVAVGDRGALRMATWGGKVNAIQKSVAERYARKGDDLVARASVFVCEACGFISIGDEPPGLCPVCKAPALRFTKVE